MEKKLCYNCFQEMDASARFCTNCGWCAEEERDKYPHALPYGTVLAGRYITGRVLGQGGFGITYVAQEYKTKRLVAIKEFFPDTMATRGTANSAVPYSGQRGEDFTYGKTTFLEEAKTLAQFNDLPGVVQVYSYFEENGTAYFAMEFVDGISLQQYINDHGGRIGWEDAQRILFPVIDALGAVHAKGIIHRDIKPDNIYLTKDGATRVLDFGSARYSMGEKSRSLDVVLTHGFAPREQYSRHGRQGAYTDVYALAATFYYAITGRKPPDSIDRLDDDSLALPSSLGAQIPRAQEDVLMKALSVEPGDRYASMSAFKSALLGQTFVQAPSAPQQPTIPAQNTAPAGQSYTDYQQRNAQSRTAPAYQQPGYAASYGIHTSRSQAGPAQAGNQMPQPQAPRTAPGQIPQGQPAAAQPYQQPYAPAGGGNGGQKKSGTPKWLIPLCAGVGVLAILAVVLIWRGTKKPAAPETDSTPETVAVESMEPTATPEPSPTETQSVQTDAPTQLHGQLGGEADSDMTGYYPIQTMTVNDSTLGASSLAGQDITGDNTYVILESNTSGVIALFDGEEMPFTLEGDQINVEGEKVPFVLQNGEIDVTVDDGEDVVILHFVKSSEAGPSGEYTGPTSGECGENATWKLEDSTLTISGTGKIDDYEYKEDIPWFKLNDKVDFVVIEDGITRIGEGNFYGCEMVDVEIPDSVEAIGAYAFMQCPYLFDITIPSSVTGIGTAALSGCPRLEWVEIESASVSIWDQVFMDCSVLDHVTFHGSIQRMESDAFKRDTTTVYYPAGDKSWDSIINHNYGGTLTWSPLAEEGVTERIYSEKYSLGLPEEWSSLYYTTVNGDYINVSHKASADAGVGGSLFTIGLFNTKDYEEYPSYQLVGTLTGSGGTYDVVAILPTDVQFMPDTQDQYMMMFNDLDAAFRHLKGENGYTFKAV